MDEMIKTGGFQKVKNEDFTITYAFKTNLY